MTIELIVDLFAGGGGASEGAEEATGRAPDIAVNHSRAAIAMHEANHPRTQHLTGDVWAVDPVGVCGGRPVGLLWASPDCTHHSKAKNGKPKSAKLRALAWVVVRWARTVKPRVICLENVEEFADWGPLDSEGQPIAAKKSWTFRRWVGCLKAAGYAVEWRELRACDYGAPTTRKRLFIVARRDGEPIVWPNPPHGPGTSRPWRTAAECIDWSIPCPSIFERKKPLAEKTLRRIARGIRKFVIDRSRPFIVPTAHAGDDRVHSIDEPLRTVTGSRRGDHAIVTPFVVPATHGDNAGGEDTRSNGVGEPLRTIVTRGAPFHLVAPTLVQTGYGEREGQAPRSLDLQKPLGTVVSCGQKHALVAAFLSKHNGGHEATGTQCDLPMHTITARDHHALSTAFLTKYYGTSTGSAADEPVPTVCAGAEHLGAVRAFLARYNGDAIGQAAQLPLGSLTTARRFGLVMVHGEPYEIADIGMRMLQPRELFRAQGFPDSYVISPSFFKMRGRGKKRKWSLGPLTKTEQIRCCGNSVPPQLAAAVIRANYTELASSEVA